MLGDGGGRGYKVRADSTSTILEHKTLEISMSTHSQLVRISHTQYLRLGDGKVSITRWLLNVDYKKSKESVRDLGGVGCVKLDVY